MAREGFAQGLLVCALLFFRVPCLHAQAVPTAPSAARAQQAAAARQAVAASRKSPEGLIHLDVAVRDGAGKFVPGLTEKDFTLLDNGVPQTIVSFRAQGDGAGEQAGGGDAQLSEIILVLDQVNLAGDHYADAKLGAITFLRRNGGHLATPVSVYLFTIGGLKATTRPMTDGNALAEMVAHERLPRAVWDRASNGHMANRSNLWDSALKAVYSIAVERVDTPGRKVVVWMSPGWLSNGLTQPAKDAFDSVAELSARLRDARVAVCEAPIWQGPSDQLHFDPNDYRTGPRLPAELAWPNDPLHFIALPVLALQSGGTIQASSHEGARAIEKCVQDVDQFYGLSFNPLPAANLNEYHVLTVKTSAPGSTARTSTGYYDQPAFYDQPRIPSRRLSVHELEATLATESGGLADELAGFELTERLTSSRLERLRSRLHGNKSKDALTALADASVFLAPPEDDVLADAAPSQAELVAMLSKTVKYLDHTVKQLPDFSATRIVAEYKQRSLSAIEPWKTALADQNLHQETTERERILYREGHEVHDDVKKKSGHGAKGKDLDFIGVFGPILRSVMNDAMRNNGKLTWARWEQGAEGREAVVAYDVHAGNSSYDVIHCCVRGRKYFKALPPYRGEMAIDPETGAILRLTMDAAPGWIVEPNLHPVLPVEATGMMVEYGRTMIGSRQAVCPLRSVVITRTRTVRQWTLWEQPVEVYAPYETQLNDIVYTDYRRFGSEAKILFGSEAQGDTPASNSGESTPSPKASPNH